MIKVHQDSRWEALHKTGYVSSNFSIERHFSIVQMDYMLSMALRNEHRNTWDSTVLLAPTLAILLVLSCSPFHEEANEACILESIRFDQHNTLRFLTVSGGNIYQVNQEFMFKGETKLVASFQFTYFMDSLIVRDQLYPDPKGTPFLSVKFEDEKPVRVIKYFAASEVKLIHSISYPEPDLIRVDLVRVASTGDVLHVGYSNYHLDSAGNVLRNQRFGVDPDDPSRFILYEDRFFTYDEYPSPQRYLYLPFFADTNFPDVKFFSANNILSFEEDGSIYSFDYEYGSMRNTLTQTLPGGHEIKFGYVNCSD